MLMLNNISILNLNTIIQYTFKPRVEAGHNNTILNWIRIKVTNKLFVKLMLMMLMSILKTARNLLQKILPQPILP